MEDQSIRGNKQLPAGEDYDYINHLVRSVCMNGDSFDKYERMLEKKYPKMDFPAICKQFLTIVNSVKEKKSFSQSDGAQLRTLGEKLHLSDETLSLILNDLQLGKEICMLSGDKSPMMKKPFSKKVSFYVIAILGLALIGLGLFVVRFNRTGNSRDAFIIHDTTIVVISDTVVNVQRDTIERLQVDTLIVSEPLSNSYQGSTETAGKTISSNRKPVSSGSVDTHAPIQLHALIHLLHPTQFSLVYTGEFAAIIISL